MDFRRLRYFVAIAESGNFHRAAERLHVAQPCLTRHMNRLEAEVGVQLLERLPRGVQTTRCGAVFLEDAKRILADLKQLRDRARAEGCNPEGCLNAGFDDSVAQNITLAKASQLMKVRCPQVRLTLTPLSETHLVESLKSRDIDVGFAYDSCGEFEMDSEIACHTIQRDDMVAVLRSDDPLAHLSDISLADLHGRPVVMIAKEKAPKLGYEHMINSCRKGGLELDIVQEVESIDALFSLVSVGVGVSLVARHVRDVLSTGVILKPLRDLHVTLALSLMWRRTPVCPITEKFVDIVKSLGHSDTQTAAVG
jgi:DNA-binding transcriptional LysR family regulator